MKDTSTGHKVAIIILNYKNWKDTIECLQSVLEITYSPSRIIIVDNDSRNNSIAHIEEFLKNRRTDYLRLTQAQSESDDVADHPLVLIKSDSNRGYASGNNIGIRLAVRLNDDYTLILNNDTLVKNDSIEPLVEFLDSNPDAAMVGPKIIDLNGNLDKNCARRRPTLLGYFFRLGLLQRLFPRNRWILRHFYTGEYDFNTPKKVDVLSGSCMMIKSSIMLQMNYLDEKTFLYLEEFILCEKIRLLQKEAFIIPASVIKHKHGSSIKNEPSLFILKKGCDSFYHYLTKYRSVPSLFAVIIMHSYYLRYYYLKTSLFIRGKNNTDK